MAPYGFGFPPAFPQFGGPSAQPWPQPQPQVHPGFSPHFSPVSQFQAQPAMHYQQQQQLNPLAGLFGALISPPAVRDNYLVNLGTQITQACNGLVAMSRAQQWQQGIQANQYPMPQAFNFNPMPFYSPSPNPFGFANPFQSSPAGMFGFQPPPAQHPGFPFQQPQTVPFQALPHEQLWGLPALPASAAPNPRPTQSATPGPATNLAEKVSTLLGSQDWQSNFHHKSPEMMAADCNELVRKLGPLTPEDKRTALDLMMQHYNFHRVEVNGVERYLRNDDTRPEPFSVSSRVETLLADSASIGRRFGNGSPEPVKSLPEAEKFASDLIKNFLSDLSPEETSQAERQIMAHQGFKLTDDGRGPWYRYQGHQVTDWR
jgi:hypothetical protein